ncbi:uncharacterized protein LOC141628605 [Silene latifolia]|uniref:uncharacterized protein LOC141628605 n=1 Tax=Silene latifolia TaxID=37657 RepID=UPI003D7721F0
MITQPIFNRDNYDNWVDALRMTLYSKDKLAFLDGTIKEPKQGKKSEESMEHIVWRQCNAMGKAWLRNLIDPKLYVNIAFSESVVQIWEELKERYATGNSPRVHQLKSELNELKQDRLTIVEYIPN